MAPKSAPPLRIDWFFYSNAIHQERGTLRNISSKFNLSTKKQLEIEYVICPQNYPQLPKKKTIWCFHKNSTPPPGSFETKSLLSSLPVFHAPIGSTASSPGDIQRPETLSWPFCAIKADGDSDNNQTRPFGNAKNQRFF